MTDKVIPIEQLEKGMFVFIDLPWSKHPFFRNAFILRTDAELATILNLGLTEIRIDVERSEHAAIAALQQVEREAAEKEAEEELPIQVEEVSEPAVAQMVKQRQRKMRLAEQAFHGAVNKVKTVLHDLANSPKNADHEAAVLIEDMVGAMLTDTDLAVQLVNTKKQSERRYMHVMNTMVLSMIVGEKMGLDRLQMKALGLGALYHDIGIDQLPDRLRLKTTRFTDAEYKLYQTHPDLGVQVAKAWPHLPSGALAIIAQHHEKLDGSGYPKGLKGDAIHPLARIVGLVDAYDHLVNGLNEERKMTPHDVVAHIYTKDKAKYDPKALAALISSIGVYPPGSVVRLSDDRIAVVTSVRNKALLSPDVLVYDERIPREQARILDLAEEGLSIVENLQRENLPAKIHAYLDLDISGYYVD